MRLTMLDGIMFGFVEGLAIGAAPRLILIADRQGAAPLRLDRMHPAFGAGAGFQRLFVGFGRRLLVPAGALLAALLIVGDGAVAGIGRRHWRQGHRNNCQDDRKNATHAAPFLGHPLFNTSHDYRLHAASRTLHWPLVRFWQLLTASSSAAARCGRLPAPQALPSPASAMAPHSRGAVRNTILHLPPPHSFVATSSALLCETSSELRPYFLLSSS